MSGSFSPVRGSTGPATPTVFFGHVPDLFTLLSPAHNNAAGNDARLDGPGPARNVNQFTIHNLQMDGGSNTPTGSLGGFITAPDGTNTAQKFVESGAGAGSILHYLSAGHVTTGTPTRCQVFAFAAERTRFVMSYYAASGGAGATGIRTVFDVGGGQVGVAPTLFGSATNVQWASISVSIVPWATMPGWYICTMDVLPGDSFVNNMSILSIYLDAGSGTGAINNTYTGNGTSGMYFWNATVLPVAAYALQTVTFFDDFTSLSTIDVNSTHAPGFNWYPEIANQWINPIYVGNPTTTAGQISQITSSAVRLSGTGTNYPWILTAAADGSGHSYPNGFISGSQFFQPPMLYECRFRFDPTKQNDAGGRNHVSPWAQTAELLTVTTPTVYTTPHMGEFDFTEIAAENVFQAWAWDCGPLEFPTHGDPNTQIGLVLGGRNSVPPMTPALGIPIWNSGHNYRTNNVVYANNVTYQLTTGDNLINSFPPSNPGNWSVFTVGNPIFNYTVPQQDWSQFHTLSILWLAASPLSALTQGTIFTFYDGTFGQGSAGNPRGGAAGSYGPNSGSAFGNCDGGHWILNLLGPADGFIDVDFVRITK